MILQIHNVIIKDKVIATQQTQIETSEQELQGKEAEIRTLQKLNEMLGQRIETLEQKIFALRTEPADKVLIEKKERRLTLLSKGEVIKTYKIALGGIRLVRKKGREITKPRRELTSSIQEQKQRLSPVSSYFLPKREGQNASKRT